FKPVTIDRAGLDRLAAPRPSRGAYPCHIIGGAAQNRPRGVLLALNPSYEAGAGGNTMKKPLTRRAPPGGAAGSRTSHTARAARAADYKFIQYHNQSATSTLHKNLVAMWDAIRAETSGRVEATVYAENNKLAAGDPAALKMLIAGEIQFFTLMGGIIGTVVPMAEVQQVPFAFRSAVEAHKAID